MEYRLITQAGEVPHSSHLISWPGSPLLAELDVPVLAEMAKSKELADSQFACAPFARITLIPQDSWQEADGLLANLRALLKTATSKTLLLDVTALENETVRSSVLRWLFNLDHSLEDLGLKSAEKPSRRVKTLVGFCNPSQQKKMQEAFHQQHAVALGMIAARRLADIPSETCTPQFVVEEAQRLCVEYPTLRCEILDEHEIQEQGLGLLHAVGKGSSRPPRLLAIHYSGADSGPVRAYVGKGITFDTGGLWLKEGAGMYTMKYDMCGAANVLGLMLSIAELGLPVRAMGVLALAENAIGPDAMQPGSVARACNGMTVEINNTDAEGRLVLADAIAWASQRNNNTRFIIDLATLTGAVVKALGYELSGLMTQDEPLRERLTQAGKISGDEVWSLPLDNRLKKQTESAIADLCNTPTNNAAISASAAWLLHHFCPPEIPWAHLDVSGTALWREGGRSVASGRPIPLLIEHLMSDLSRD
ncbi:leucyl aminopeptidase family protein [Enterobacteriaceae bacterium 89]|nr:leucyl aminopeptidase family protein [Enterobacteriaceae bacterium 89]